eukprot:scaffold25174_cov59-Phaeocystis_antarctica.AAC.1
MRLGGPSLETVTVRRASNSIPTLTRPRTRGKGYRTTLTPRAGRRAESDDVAAEIAEPARAC